MAGRMMQSNSYYDQNCNKPFKLTPKDNYTRYYIIHSFKDIKKFYGVNKVFPGLAVYNPELSVALVVVRATANGLWLLEEQGQVMKANILDSIETLQDIIDTQYKLGNDSCLDYALCSIGKSDYDITAYINLFTIYELCYIRDIIGRYSIDEELLKRHQAIYIELQMVF